MKTSVLYAVALNSVQFWQCLKFDGKLMCSIPEQKLISKAACNNSIQITMQIKHKMLLGARGRERAAWPPLLQ